MSSEWMKVMLEEISRKKAETEQARAEETLRAEERQREDERQQHVAPERQGEPERKAGPARQVEQVHGDRPAVPSGSRADRARG